MNELKKLKHDEQKQRIMSSAESTAAFAVQITGEYLSALYSLDPVKTAKWLSSKTGVQSFRFKCWIRIYSLGVSLSTAGLLRTPRPSKKLSDSNWSRLILAGSGPTRVVAYYENDAVLVAGRRQVFPIGMQSAGGAAAVVECAEKGAVVQDFSLGVPQS